jgi:hypothetical protein
MLCRLREPIGLPVSGKPKEQQLEYLHELAEETGSPMPADLMDRTVADAWIAAMHDKRAAMSLEQLRPEPGDVVQIPPFAGQELRIVASIASDGLLYFRGGPGQKIRPHHAIMAARKSDPNYAKAKYAAEQQTAARVQNPRKVTARTVGDLQQWKVSGRPDLTSYHTLAAPQSHPADYRLARMAWRQRRLCSAEQSRERPWASRDPDRRQSADYYFAREPYRRSREKPYPRAG